jgi:hypothetical protein
MLNTCWHMPSVCPLYTSCRLPVILAVFHNLCDLCPKSFHQIVHASVYLNLQAAFDTSFAGDSYAHLVLAPNFTNTYFTQNCTVSGAHVHVYWSAWALLRMGPWLGCTG